MSKETLEQYKVTLRLYSLWQMAISTVVVGFFSGVIYITNDADHKDIRKDYTRLEEIMTTGFEHVTNEVEDVKLIVDDHEERLDDAEDSLHNIQSFLRNKFQWQE